MSCALCEGGTHCEVHDGPLPEEAAWDEESQQLAADEEDAQRIISRLGRLRRSDWQRLSYASLMAVESAYDRGIGR